MGANRHSKQAARNEGGTGGRGEGMVSRGLSRQDTCSCHPRAWGLKKGLRRARRRRSRAVIREFTSNG